MERTAIDPVIWSVQMGFEHGVLASRSGAAGVAPATTLLGVTRPAMPVLRVELEATAVS